MGNELDEVGSLCNEFRAAYKPTYGPKYRKTKTTTALPIYPSCACGAEF
jgi:hypothetical protein